MPLSKILNFNQNPNHNRNEKKISKNVGLEKMSFIIKKLKIKLKPIYTNLFPS